MATGRLAVLSNVNMNMVIRMLQKQAEVYDAEGYGNELGALLNPASPTSVSGRQPGSSLYRSRRIRLLYGT